MNTSAVRLRKISDLLLSKHRLLKNGDVCCYIGEYCPRKGYKYSEFNQLIFNLKKPTSRKNEADYKYKEKAIQEVSGMLSRALEEEQTRKAICVPVPAS